jgi:hypothetical protein
VSTYFFRDQLTIDDSLPGQLAALGITPGSGETLVLGAATCQLSSLPGGLDYIIMADSLSTAPVVQMALATGRSVSIYAETITTVLQLDAPGSHGAPGTAGKAGLDGERVILNGKPHILPGGNGGDGGNGSSGGAGGHRGHLLRIASDVHFDYGYLHPDTDYNLIGQPVQRVLLSLESLATLPADVITWNQIFVALNEAQSSGYDIVHPVIEVVINDESALDQLRSGSGLQFSVGIGPDPAGAAIPSDIYELKVDSLQLELVGAVASGAALVWAQHNGHWVMKRPPTADLPEPPDIEFSLFSHVEAFNVAAGSDPGAAIPAQPQTAAEPGPPFSFWGRGALADWALFVDPSAGAALDLTGLTELRLSIGCIGLVVQGTVTPATLQIAPSANPVPASTRRSEDTSQPG